MYGRNTKSDAAGGAGKGKKNTSPIRVVVKCAWSGTRLTVPCDPPIRASSTTLLDLIQRLQPELPPSLFLSGNDGSATLVCLRKLVPQSQWGTTTLGSILDGDDGAAGVVLTLDLGGAGGGGGRSDAAVISTISAAPTTMTMARAGPVTPIDNAISSAASLLNIKPAALIVESSSVHAIPTTAALTIPEPMDIVDDRPKKISPEEAWEEILRSNFDATTKDCLLVLLKLIDNLLSRPDEPKFRSIRCANAAFEKKVGMAKGGYEFLYSVGFLPKYPAFVSSTLSPEMLELISENESREMLLRGRSILTQSAITDLGMSEEELPAPPNTKSTPVVEALKPLQSSTTIISGGFDIYKGHSYNIQSAAVGAPDPYGDKGMSTTERQLQNLQSKKEKLEREMQSIGDRGLVAYNAGETPQIAASAGGDGGEGKSDGSLLAARMKRMEDERKKREEGGFTTKAMRDLESMKKAKVYSHAQIRINFPDGKHLHAKFLPSENISSIRSVIKSACEPSLAVSLDFDLYVAPPRRLLNDSKTLTEEELVPAAKIHISWKVGASPIGDYLLDELFSGGSVSAFPDAKPVVRQQSTTATSIGVDSNIAGSGVAVPSKEELLMQRMLGKSTGLLSGKKKSGDSDKDDGKKNGKPKWLK